MSHRYRSLNRFAVALALAVVFVGARVSVQMFAAPTVTFDTLPNLNFNQGQNITVAVAAQGFPTDVTYTADGLPAGLSITMGVDTLGHTVGILGGTLAQDTADGGGSEGAYNVRLRASDGAISNVFTIDVSHWSEGDVFVGGGQKVYQVYRQDGSFKSRVTLPDELGLEAGYTTGCAVNWHTGEVWATNFDDYYPALNVITRHAGPNPLPYTDPSRRLSTERYGKAGSLTPTAGNTYAFDIDPESVAFDNAGNMLVGHSFGYWNDNGDVADENGTSIILHSPTGAGWIYVDATGEPLRDINNNYLFDSDQISPAGFFEKWVTGGLPVNVLGLDGLPIRVPLQGGMDVHKYAPDADGNYHQNDRTFFDLHYGNTGVDTLDLLSDQKTAIYSSEDWYVFRYDFAAAAQLPVLGSSILGESRPVNNGPTYGLRALPPGDGSGGYLVVNQFNIQRLNADGQLVQVYDAGNDPDYPGDGAGWSPNDVNGWFAIAIAPGGRTFWAATRTDVFHFDLASGATIGTKITATRGTLHTPEELAGLCVMDEYRAAQEVCGPTGLGNGVDDDQDGTIDEGCFKVEVCSSFSPGDDDGDGLVDYNDPDCGAAPAQQCVVGGPTDNSVAGICARADYEGDSVVVPGVPLPCPGGDCTNWTFNFSATGLPAGLVMNPLTGDVSGIPLFSIVNPNSELSAPVVFHVTVHSSWKFVDRPATSFTNTFDWTIYNRNRVPVANDDGPQTLLPGASATFTVLANDSDIDGDAISILSFTQPPTGQGSVVQVGQQLKYTAPASGFSGVTTFTYKVKDTYNPAGVSNDATVTVLVNDVPVAADDAFTTPEDTALTATVKTNDRLSLDGGNTFALLTGTSNGAVVLNANGTFTYTPNANYNGTDSFTYKLCDVTPDCSNARVTITITPVNDLPVAVNDAFTTAEDTPVSGTLKTNDTLSGDGGNVWSMVSNPSNGTAIVNADGTFIYTPNTNFNGTDSFKYQICDVDGDCSIATVTITITAVNDVPVAVNDAFTTPEDTVLNGTVKGNDTLSGDGGNTWARVSNASNGNVTVNADGTFTYTPNANYNGIDSFTYKICDVDGDCSTATVTITITPTNDVPVAGNDAFTTAEDTAITATVTGNDTPSPDGGNVWTRTSNPANGSVTVNANGTFTYTPNANYNGTDSFAYKLCDVDGDCSPATVTITITPSNDVPVAVNDAFTTAEDTVLNGSVKGNDTPSPDGGNVWSLVTGTTNGTVTVNADGTFTYTPNANYNGTDAFTYKVCDVDGDCSTAIATITITPVDDFPVARNDAFTTNEDTPVVGTLTGNDTLSGDGGNVWTLVTGAAHGAAIVNADGTFSYSPAANFNGVDTFTYKICDADGDCSTAVVTITILSVNDVPEALDDSYTTQEDTAVSGTVITNDTLSGDGGNVWTLVSTTSNGTLTFTNGAFTYTPKKDFNGVDSFVYKLCDLNGDCSLATATITINPTNDVPVAVNDVYSMAPNTSITKDVSGNDTASADGGNVWTKTSNPSSGTVVFNTNGTFTYTAVTGFSGVVSFTYKVCDVDNDCSNATVTITIAALVTGAVGKGDTATIGFWQNQNGQALILKVNGSSASTGLGNWLASSFPFMWGANAAAANNLTGKTNTQVAAYYLTVFKSDKWTAQVLAGAIASYVTSSTLAGSNYAVPYGFNYSVTGTGTKTYNVGSYGTAIGLVNNTSYTVSALLQQANLRKLQGTYNSNAFNVIFSGINVLGDIVK